MIVNYNCNCSFIVLATFIMIVNYDHKTFIVQATSVLLFQKLVNYFLLQHRYMALQACQFYILNGLVANAPCVCGALNKHQWPVKKI